MSSKASSHTSNLMVQSNGTLHTKPAEVAEVMNSHYSTIADSIGSDPNIPKHQGDTAGFVKASIDYHKNHPSVTAIRDYCPKQDFSFQPVDPSTVSKAIHSFDKRKGAGSNTISVRSMQVVSDLIAPSLATIFNTTVSTGIFPSSAKEAEIVPVYKKSDPLEPKNYRPVSILNASSKVLERLYEQQLKTKFLDAIYNDRLSAYRAGYSCQHVLLDICEQWRKAIDDQKSAGLLLLDLSKAFDCLPHSLIVAKLRAYGMSIESVELLADYLSDRKQRVKLSGIQSLWNNILKGVPQGSILGPAIFNVFINDIFIAIKDGTLFNYADDNSVLVDGDDRPSVIAKIQSNSKELMTWCSSNEMEANPSKFQLMLSGDDRPVTVTIDDGACIESEKSVRLLGIDLDSDLKFNVQVKRMVRNASLQINSLKRFSKILITPVKFDIYRSFILANFNFCPAVWHNCGAGNTKKLEKLQHRALRFVFNDYSSSYESLIARANLPTLEIGRLRTMACEVYKAMNELAPPPMTELFKNHEHSIGTRNASSNGVFQERKRTTNHGLHSFQIMGTRIWNSLPKDVRLAENYGAFKRMVKNTEILPCHCKMCQF